MIPKISVLMPVYNGAGYLHEAIDSILNQTFTDFEFLIINDGSSDETEEIVSSYSDRRIRYIRNSQNMGIVNTLNRGIKEANGEYLARMDADDISLPNRLMKQNNYLDQNPNVGVCGTWINAFGSANYQRKYPVDNNMIRAMMFFESPLAHPSVMIRINLFKDNSLFYREEYRHAEDYDMWQRAMDVTELSNIPDVLFKYRVHGNSISKIRLAEQNNVSAKVRNNILSKVGFKHGEINNVLHEKIALLRPDINSLFLDECSGWLGEIIKVNKVSKYVDSISLQEIIAIQWYEMANILAHHELIVYPQYVSNARKDDIPLVPIMKRMRLLLKSNFRLFSGKLGLNNQT